jgi:hypothetical protein
VGRWSAEQRVLSDHECECGCGGLTYIAPVSDPRYGHVKGQPMRYCRGHRDGARAHRREPSISEDGYCLCGCGGVTPVAPRSIHRLGQVKGEHVAYLPGHNTGKKLGEGCLYFIGVDDGPIKVGWTVEIVRRMREFQIAHWQELRLYGQIDGPASIEREAHARLSGHRVRREWFERDAALALLSALRSTGLDRKMQ